MIFDKSLAVLEYIKQKPATTKKTGSLLFNQAKRYTTSIKKD